MAPTAFHHPQRIYQMRLLAQQGKTVIMFIEKGGSWKTKTLPPCAKHVSRQLFTYFQIISRITPTHSHCHHFQPSDPDPDLTIIPSTHSIKPSALTLEQETELAQIICSKKKLLVVKTENPTKIPEYFSQLFW